MNNSGLSLEQAPPLQVPMRFFFTLPVFGLYAAATLFWYGPDIFISRWAVPALALTHILTLGFISMAIFGAMQQLLPVLAGSPVKHPGAVSAVLHGLLSLGAFALSFGLLSAQPPVILAALPILFSAFCLFLVISFISLFNARAHSATIVCIWLATISLAIAIGLGLYLGAERALATPQTWGDVHLIWALAGWAGLTIIGVAYQVVPMFLLTPAYPAWMRRWLAPALFALLFIYSGANLLPDLWRKEFFDPVYVTALLMAGLCVFALTTMHLQRQRRRCLPDVTLEYWRLGMASLLVFSLFWLAESLWSTSFPRLEIFLGLLLVIGVVLSLICGMLYKIIPFMLWFHLQSKLEEYVKLPSMKELLPDRPARRQLYTHAASLLCLLAACVWPEWLARPAALLFAVSNLMLGMNLFSAGRKYQQARAMLDTLGE